MAPSLVQAYEVNSAAKDTSTLTTASFTPAVGEIIIVTAFSEDSTLPLAGTVSGGSSTWQTLYSNTATSNCTAYAFATTIASTASMAVSVPGGGANSWHCMCVSRWSGAQLAATPAVGTSQSNTASSTTVTTVANGSVVVWGFGDWNAVTPGTVTYRSGATQLAAADPIGSPTAMTGYFAYQSAATAGSQTFGVSTPTGLQCNMVGIEVQASGGPASLPPAGLIIPNRAQAIRRASFF